MLGMLAALGAGFDCASVMELEAAQALGVAPERIIFANPCKKPADFRCGTNRCCICTAPGKVGTDACGIFIDTRTACMAQHS
jgi:diaminopimelate decarboxylase